MAKKKNVKKERRIEAELSRLSLLFVSLPENQLTIVNPLLQNSAFMKITLEDLQESVNINGTCETYQNGANQSGTKPSADLQSYNKMVTNYAAVQQKLIALLPDKRDVDESDPMEQLLSGTG